MIQDTIEQHLFTKTKVAFSSTKLVLQLYSSTKYKLYFIFVHKNCFSYLVEIINSTHIDLLEFQLDVFKHFLHIT